MSLASSFQHCQPVRDACNTLLSVLQTLRLSIRTEDGGHGRTTMINNLLKVFDREGQLVEQREVDSVEGFKDALASHFGIVPSSSSCT